MSARPDPTATARSRRRRRARWALAAGAAFGTLLVAEAGLRVLAWLGDRKAEAAWAQLDEAPAPPAGKDASLGHIVRRCPDPRVVYELIPNLRGVRFQGVELTTDSHGFREPERPIERPSGGVRIVALGDSVAFGWGVPEADTMLRRLERRLREHLDRPVDVVNMAVPGYNTCMQVAQFERKGLQFRPDLVIVDFCGNDTDLPNLLWRERDHLTLARSYLVDLVAGALGVAGVEAAPGPFEHAATRESNGQLRMEFDPERVPARYRDMVGWAAWRRAMTRLVELSREHSFRVILTSAWFLPDEVREFCPQIGVPFISAGARLVRWMNEHGVDEYRGSELTLSSSDPHPTSLGHRLQFEVYWEALQAIGIDRLLARPR